MTDHGGLARYCVDCGTPLSADAHLAGLCPPCLLKLGVDAPSRLGELADTEAPTARLAEGGVGPGRVTGERYSVRNLLGSGGMGEVWRAFDLKLRIDVALKALRQDFAEQAGALETLRQEVRSAREVTSPNVCRIFDLVEVDGRELVSMEYVDGTTLTQVIRDRGPLPLDLAREIAAQFLAGLEAIHEAGLVHRDLKPDNIMLTRAGRVVVMDFGIAKGLAERRTGDIAGTPAYMAPEQARGEAVDPRADIFSTGLVLAEMVEPGGLPSREARRRLLERLHRTPPELSETPWASVIEKALAPDPVDRFPSASALARALEEVTLRAAIDEDLQPYPGLASFTAEDAEYFFGRELEVEEMIKRLGRPHLMALIGPSGAGKSSFLRAGLLPVLPDDWATLVITPGERPFAALGQALAATLADDADVARGWGRLDEPQVVDSLLRHWRERQPHSLLVVDQFEELFTLAPPEERQRFADLLGWLPVETDVHVLLAMRDDFLIRCQAHSALRPAFSELTPLGPLAGSGLRRALVQPALKCGYRFEDDALVDEMMTEVEGERGALPLLAFAAARLWERRDREAGHLTRRAYEEIGGVGGALAQHAEATLEQVGLEHEPIAREIFRNLVTAQGTRATRDRGELLSVFDDHTRATAGEVVDALVDARLLTSYEQPAGPGDDPTHRLEVIHESLLSHWPRLVRWRTQDAGNAQLRDQLRQAAHLWKERGRPDDLLWTGTSFGEYKLWRERYEGGLSEAEETFATAMTTRAERRQRQRRAAITTAFAALLVIVGVIGGLWRQSVNARREAETAEKTAEAEARHAEASKLLALGRLELERSSTNALAHALASLRLDDSEPGRRFALEALSRGPTAFVLGHELAFEARFSPDGDWLASGGTEGRLDLWSRRGGEARRLLGHVGNTLPVAFDASGTRLVSSEQRRAHTLKLWTIPATEAAQTVDLGQLRELEAYPCSDGQHIVTLDVGSDGSTGILFKSWSLDPLGEPTNLLRIPFGDGWRDWEVDPSCRWLGYAAYGLSAPNPEEVERTVRIVPLDGSPARIAGVLEEPIKALGFDAAGEQLLTAGTEGEIRIRPLDGSAAGGRRLQGASGALSLDLDPTGRWLAAGGTDQETRVWDLEGPSDAQPVIFRHGELGYIYRARFSPDARWLVTAAAQGTLLWPLRPDLPTVLSGHTEAVQAVRFLPGGTHLVTTSGDGSVRMWGLSPDLATQVFDGNLQAWDLDLDAAGRQIVFPQFSWVALATLETLRGLVGLEHNLFTAAIDPTGRWAASAGGRDVPTDAPIRLWDLESVRWVTEASGLDIAQPTLQLDAGDLEATWALRFLDSDRLLAGGSAGVRLWSVSGGSWVEISPEPTARLAVSADGRFAIGKTELGTTHPGRAQFHELTAGDSRFLDSHGTRVRSVAISADGDIVATGDLDGAVRVGPASGAEPHVLLGHAGPVTAVAISADGKWVASGGQDTTVRLWPMPDLDQPPLLSLPHDELLARLETFSNVRVVRDPESAEGWKLTIGPFPGWEEVPEW